MNAKDAPDVAATDTKTLPAIGPKRNPAAIVRNEAGKRSTALKAYTETKITGPNGPAFSIACSMVGTNDSI
jgi:hypothetical protein